MKISDPVLHALRTYSEPKTNTLSSSTAKYKLPEGRVIISSKVGEQTRMTQKSNDDNKKYNSSRETVEIDPEVIMKLLSQIPDGPLINVEDVIIPEPLPRFSILSRMKSSRSKRGPRSIKDWNKEIRTVLGHLYDIEVLEKSWLAQLPMVQKLAAKEHGGRTIGSGLALQAVLKQALIDVQEYDMEPQTRVILTDFPKKKIIEIASELKLDRSYLSRRYVTRAISILTVAFQRIIDRSV